MKLVRLLLADDHVLLLDALKHLLETEYSVVGTASNGAELIAEAIRLKPDIIITEVLVPKLDGLALCRAVKNDPQLRHIVMLVFSILAVQSRASEAGADAFLMKPLAEKRLVDTVRQLLLLRRPSTTEGARA